MDKAVLYSVDRTENEWVILVDDTGNSHQVLISDFSAAVRVGDLFTCENGVYVPQQKETEKRRNYALSLQEKLRRKN